MRDVRYAGRFDADETEAATMLVSLSRSTSPSFSPPSSQKSGCNSPRVLLQSPLTVGSRHNLFMPIAHGSSLVSTSPPVPHHTSPPSWQQIKPGETVVSVSSLAIASTPTDRSHQSQSVIRPEILRPKLGTSVIQMSPLVSSGSTSTSISTSGLITVHTSNAGMKASSESQSTRGGTFIAPGSNNNNAPHHIGIVISTNSSGENGGNNASSVIREIKQENSSDGHSHEVNRINPLAPPPPLTVMKGPMTLAPLVVSNTAHHQNLKGQQQVQITPRYQVIPFTTIQTSTSGNSSGGSGGTQIVLAHPITTISSGQQHGQIYQQQTRQIITTSSGNSVPSTVVMTGGGGTPITFKAVECSIQQNNAGDRSEPSNPDMKWKTENKYVQNGGANYNGIPIISTSSPSSPPQLIIPEHASSMGDGGGIMVGVRPKMDSLTTNFIHLVEAPRKGSNNNATNTNAIVITTSSSGGGHHHLQPTQLLPVIPTSGSGPPSDGGGQTGNESESTPKVYPWQSLLPFLTPTPSPPQHCSLNGTPESPSSGKDGGSTSNLLIPSNDVDLPDIGDDDDDVFVGVSDALTNVNGANNKRRALRYN